jgi:hypothetical protein
MDPRWVAAPSVYDMDVASGQDSIVGTITTDGALGNLRSSDFLSWNLKLTAGAASESVVGVNGVGGASAFTLGLSVSATTTALLLDFTQYGNSSSFALGSPVSSFDAYNFGFSPTDFSGFQLYFTQGGATSVQVGAIPEPKIAGIEIARAEVHGLQAWSAPTGVVGSGSRIVYSECRRPAGLYRRNVCSAAIIHHSPLRAACFCSAAPPCSATAA